MKRKVTTTFEVEITLEIDDDLQDDDLLNKATTAFEDLRLKESLQAYHSPMIGFFTSDGRPAMVELSLPERIDTRALVIESSP